MKDFTIKNAVARVKAEGDLFTGTLGSGIDMEKAVNKAQSVFY
jgi:bifunctional non-homologous end joining protein LigD